MVLITPEDGPNGLSTSIRSLEQVLNDMRAEIEERYQEIRAGNLSDLKDVTKVTAELRQWLRIAIEVEAQLEKRNKHEKGIVHDYALDFDAARASICCRMDRLRRARCPGRLSQCSG